MTKEQFTLFENEVRKQADERGIDITDEDINYIRFEAVFGYGYALMFEENKLSQVISWVLDEGK
jgi:hypothetical protein